MRLAQLVDDAIQIYSLNENDRVKLLWYFSPDNVLTQAEMSEALGREDLKFASAVAYIVEKLEGILKDEW